jgi:hypothetical protein
LIDGGHEALLSFKVAGAVSRDRLRASAYSSSNISGARLYDMATPWAGHGDRRGIGTMIGEKKRWVFVDGTISAEILSDDVQVRRAHFHYNSRVR